MFKNPKHTLLFFVLVTGLAGLLLGSGSDRGPHFTAPPIHLKTASERQASLEALRQTWDARPEAHSAANEKAERYFLNRVIYFVRSTRGREIYGDACRFWNECYRDHATRYRDFVDAE
ncbi:MAG: hypothetical protein HYV95_13830 [Opitutae bacterium]|nr:hypothetical protein [Opitutae bacterium]